VAGDAPATGDAAVVAAGWAAGAAGEAAVAGLASAGLLVAAGAAGADEPQAARIVDPPSAPNRPAAPRSRARLLIVEDITYSLADGDRQPTLARTRQPSPNRGRYLAPSRV
jgi:hypothetical protein